MKGKRWVIAAAVAGLAVWAWFGGGAKDRFENSSSARAAAPAEATPATFQPVAVSGRVVPVASDPNAVYRVISVDKQPNGRLLMLSSRLGPSGLSFAEREISCSGMFFRYTREGDALAELLGKPFQNGPVSTLSDGSISDVLVRYACERADG